MKEIVFTYHRRQSHRSVQSSPHFIVLLSTKGQDSRTVCGDGVIYQKGGANDRALMPKIVTTDIETCQGLVHVIDGIIMLPASVAM